MSKYVLPTVPNPTSELLFPMALKSMPNAPSQLKATITDQDVRDSLLKHCQHEYERRQALNSSGTTVPAPV